MFNNLKFSIVWANLQSSFKDLIYSLSLYHRPYLQIQSCWGLGLQHMNRRVGARFCPCTWFNWLSVLSALAADVNLLPALSCFSLLQENHYAFCKKAFGFLLDFIDFLSFLSLCYCLGFKKIKMFSKFIVFSDLKVLVQIANTEVYEYKQDSEIITDSLIQ